MRIRLVFGSLVLVCAGCSNPSPLGPGLGGGGGAGGGGLLPNGACSVRPMVLGGVVRAGAPAEVTVGLTIQFCPDAGPIDSVAVSVVDPHNVTTALPGAVLQRTEINNQSVEFTTQVTFMPDRPGDWTVAARFDPLGLSAAGSFLAVASRTDAGFRVVPSAPAMRTCVAFGALASGIPVCVPAIGVSPTCEAVYVGSQAILGQAFAVDGDALWVMQARTIERWAIGSDGGIGLTHSENLPLAVIPPQLAARDGRAFVAQGDSTIARLDPGPASVLTVTPLSIGSRIAQVVFAAPDRVLASASSVNASGTQLIELALDGGGTVTPVQQGFQRGLSDDGVHWTIVPRGTITEETRRVLIAVRFTGGVFLFPELTVPMRVAEFPYARLSPQTPLIPIGDGGLSAIPVFTSAALALEAFDPGPGFGPVVSATATHAFALSTDGTLLKIIDR